MNQFTTSHILSRGLLILMLLSTTPAWATKPTEGSLASNTKVGIDFGFGCPYAWVGKKEKEFSGVEASPNISLGVTLGYSFPLSNLLRIGPEIGINYGFTRQISTPANLSGISLEEKHIQIPIAVKFYALDKEDFDLTGGLCLGYEFDIALSSQYKEHGLDVSDLPQPLGNVFFGGTVDYKSFYLVGKLKLPLEVISIKEAKASEKKLYASRGLGKSFVEIQLGVDIMKWLYQGGTKQ